MPDTIPNPFAEVQSPLGAALKNLGGALGKKNTEAADIAHVEYALKQKQERENTAALGERLRQLGTDQFDRRAAIDNAVRAGVGPDAIGGYERYNSANQYGATDQRTVNAQIGAGGAYGNTSAGVREGFANTTNNEKLRLTESGRQADQSLIETRRQFDFKPQTIGTDKGPVIAPLSQAYGQPAVEDLGKVKGDAARRAINAPGGLAGADETTRQFIGAEGKGASTPHNYIAGGNNFITYDGTTDATTGKPLPTGGYIANAQGPAKDVGLNTSVTSDLQKQDIENQKFRGLLGYTRNLAKSDPNNFGVTGYVKGAVQDINAVAGNIAQGLGYKGVADAAAAARQKAVESGVDPHLISGVFDPKLPALHTAADLLVFQAAQALAGQSGRGVSDRDIKIFKNIVGDPNDVMGNQQKFMAKLDTIEQILDINQHTIDGNLRRSAPPSATPPAAPGAAPPPNPVAPGAPPNTPTPQPDMSQARQAPNGNYYVPDPSRPGQYMQVVH